MNDRGEHFLGGTEAHEALARTLSDDVMIADTGTRHSANSIAFPVIRETNGHRSRRTVLVVRTNKGIQTLPIL